MASRARSAARGGARRAARRAGAAAAGSRGCRPAPWRPRCRRPAGRCAACCPRRPRRAAAAWARTPWPGCAATSCSRSRAGSLCERSAAIVRATIAISSMLF